MEQQKFASPSNDCEKEMLTERFHSMQGILQTIAHVVKTAAPDKSETDALHERIKNESPLILPDFIRWGRRLFSLFSTIESLVSQVIGTKSPDVNDQSPALNAVANDDQTLGPAPPGEISSEAVAVKLQTDILQLMYSLTKTKQRLDQKNEALQSLSAIIDQKTSELASLEEKIQKSEVTLPPNKDDITPSERSKTEGAPVCRTCSRLLEDGAIGQIEESLSPVCLTKKVSGDSGRVQGGDKSASKLEKALAIARINMLTPNKKTRRPAPRPRKRSQSESSIQPLNIIKYKKSLHSLSSTVEDDGLRELERPQMMI